jgi:hypothetical protein
VHHCTSAPDQPVVASHCRDYGGCLDHSSEAHERSSKLCIVFYASLRAHLAVRTPYLDGLSNLQQAGGYVWKILEERHTLYKRGIMYSIIRLVCLLIRQYISAVNSLGVLCLSSVWINLARRFPCALTVQNLESYSSLILPSCRGPETWRQADSHNRAGGNSYSSF